MIITWLLCGLALAAAIQPNAPRFFAAVLFVVVTLSHELFLSHTDGGLYYGTAALFDLVIIILTTGISPIPRMVVDLHKICMYSIIANFIGWVLWHMYLPPLAYDAAFVVIYAWALITLIKRNGNDVGGYTVDSWRSCFHVYRRAWGRYRTQHESKI